jgi:hypothetical protein
VELGIGLLFPKQMGQVASSVGKLDAQMNGKFPSQALYPIENVSEIMLRSGKELEEQRSKQIENVSALNTTIRHNYIQ